MQLHIKNNSQGFTLPELLVAMSMFAILIGLVTINLAHSQGSANITSAVDTFIADINAQQVKAMTGETGGALAASSYGVHFDTADYVLFKGTTYTAGDASNTTIPIDGGVTIVSTTFPNNQIIFNQADGEVAGLLSGQADVTLKTPNGTQKTVSINKYGVIVSVN